KLITKVVTTAGATTTAEATKVSVPRKRRGVVIQDPKKTTSTVVMHSEQDEAFARLLEAKLNANINWNAVIEQVKRSERSNDAVINYQALKRKPLSEAQAKKNMIIYLKNMAGYKMNYFKGMTYSHSTREGGHSIKKEITKKQKMDEEAEELKSHLQIVFNDDDDDDVYTKATPLASKIPIVDYKIHLERNKPYFKIIRADDLFHASTALDIEILIQTCLMPLAIKTQGDSLKFVHELKQEMHADLKYVESLEKEIDELESKKAEFSDMYDVILHDCVLKDVMCSYLQSLSDLDALAELQFCVILGYGDLVQGNVTISRVYYVEGLNHNLFSVSQFCDANLEVAFRKSTYFIRDLQSNDLLVDHPVEQVCGNPSSPVKTRRQLTTDPEMCMFALTVSTAKPKNIKEAMADSAWIETMQEELHQFDRLQAQLVAKGYAQEEGLQIHQSLSGIFISQAKYTLEILHKHGMDKGQSIGTPMAMKPKLDADLSGN
nr:integrase, catalytic region, zinc finger, CCHC-type, peptidase aspartic, catalytic [Tanacetum cinerariifolium]